MTALAVLVPVKSSDAKSRLSPVLSDSQRKALAASLFRGLMATLTRAGLVASCRVVSSDRRVLDAARSFGATPVIEGSDSGVNAAVLAGVRDARGASEFLVLPSDLPLLRASDLAALLRLRRLGSTVVMAPSLTFDGTNALLFPRAPDFPLSFDSDSFWNHLAGASRLGLTVGVCARKGIMFDVDSPADLRTLAGSGARTESARLARAAAQ
ncbi:MAG: 2-phospho-L-lactate guanylyltransferase [Nitrososphaerota archaeon]|nr:2-phospho-L-lactate guanylyltransferase [Nitrososphaerota archaeon]